MPSKGHYELPLEKTEGAFILKKEFSIFLFSIFSKWKDTDDGESCGVEETLHHRRTCIQRSEIYSLVQGGWYIILELSGSGISSSFQSVFLVTRSHESLYRVQAAFVLWRPFFSEVPLLFFGGGGTLLRTTSHFVLWNQIWQQKTLENWFKSCLEKHIFISVI